MIDGTDKWWLAWFLVIWKTMWHLWRSDGLPGWPDRGLLRGVLRFLRLPRVPLGMLVIWVISLRECLAPWNNLKALLLRLGVHSTMRMMYLNRYWRIGVPFIIVVKWWLKLLVVDRNLKTVPGLSLTHCKRPARSRKLKSIKDLHDASPAKKQQHNRHARPRKSKSIKDLHDSSPANKAAARKA